MQLDYRYGIHPQHKGLNQPDARLHVTPLTQKQSQEQYVYVTLRLLDPLVLDHIIRRPIHALQRFLEQLHQETPEYLSPYPS